MDRRILHLDIDAFLASVEQLRDPTLRGRPVAVGTGVVASRSYEAKARGVATAMPLYEALRRCPDLVVRPGDARLCERYRQRTAETLRLFSPVVEVCSLDDFYADLTGVPLRVQQALCDATASDGERSLRPLCEDIRAAVREATGLSVAQGVGNSRTVARLACIPEDEVPAYENEEEVLFVSLPPFRGRGCFAGAVRLQCEYLAHSSFHRHPRPS